MSPSSEVDYYYYCADAQNRPDYWAGDPGFVEWRDGFGGGEGLAGACCGGCGLGCCRCGFYVLLVPNKTSSVDRKDMPADFQE